MMTKAKERSQAAGVLIQEASRPLATEDAGRIVAGLQLIGRRLHRLYEDACNHARTERQQAAADKREAQLIAEARALLEPYGVGLGVQSDPRGNPLSILTPKTRAANTMGGAESGWRV